MAVAGAAAYLALGRAGVPRGAAAAAGAAVAVAVRLASIRWQLQLPVYRLEAARRAVVVGAGFGGIAIVEVDPAYFTNAYERSREGDFGLLGLIEEEMGWGTEADGLRPYLPPAARLVEFEDSGHFIHIEHPERVAELVLEFLS